MVDAYPLLRPLLFKLPPETAHDLTLKALKTGLVPRYRAPDNPALRVTLWNRVFPNPVGLAAGFDKNAEVIGPMFGLGFGFVEAGTVTPKPQAGNPKPRVFRDKESLAVINAMGFPNRGVDAFKASLEKFLASKPRPAGLVGLNIGMNKDQSEPAKDYRLLVSALAPLADYMTINISSPNTPGLRDLQKREALLDLIGHVRDERAKACGKHDQPPLLLKLAPDLNRAQQEELAQAAIDAKIDGLILTNTTLSRPKGLDPEFAARKGGLSGEPLRKKSTEIIRSFYTLTGGTIPIIGLGGVGNAADAYEKIRAGATLIQLYTKLAFYGPSVVCEIITGLESLLNRDGYTHITQAVGADTGMNKGKTIKAHGV